jgi:outer membrane lipoprotein LolB
VRRPLAGLAGLVLAACASTPPPPGSGITSGRLSLRVEATAQRSAQSLTAGFELQGSSERGELRLISPLGTQVAAARWSPGEAQLTTSDGTVRFAGLPELSRGALGEDVPLAALPDWLAGRPWPGAAHQVAPDGFEQLGWQVNLARRAEGWVEARRAAPPAVTLRVRLEASAP